MSEKRQILVSVDFGTTFTGVAYSDPSNSQNEPFLFTEWPKLNSDKVPTVLRYNVPEKIRSVGGLKWGHQVKADERRHEWFKLGLDPMQLKAATSVDLSGRYPSKLEESPHYEKTARNIATDFLTSVRKHVIAGLTNRYGAAAFDALEVRWILTVPAVWSPEAKNATRECAEAAGMGNRDSLMMTSEPEAAAVYALKKIEPHNLEVGNNIVICDAGGGTVDLVTYRIKSLTPTLQVEESGVCSGGKCGSVFLNRVFEDWLDSKLGQNTISEQSRAEMRTQWEYFTKRQFDDEEEDDYYLPIPGARDDHAVGIRGGRLSLSPKDAKKFFDIVIDPIVTLVRGQINDLSGFTGRNKVSAVVLVGGFSECEYLAKRLRAEFQSNNLTIIKCPNAWTAVARGAVMKGLEGSHGIVRSRKSICGYGTSHSAEFQEGVHRQGNKYFDSYEGKNMCRNLMTWFVDRGDDLDAVGAKNHEFYRIVTLDDSLIFADDIYETFEDDSPQYNTENCKVLGTLRSDLSTVPKWKFDRFTAPNGVECYKIEYTVLAVFGSVDIELKLDIKGTVHSSVKLDYANSKLPKR